MNNYFKNRDSMKGSVNIIKQVLCNTNSLKLDSEISLSQMNLACVQ